MSEEKKFTKTVGDVSTIIRPISSGGTGGSPVHVDTKDGKILRIRPMRWNERYTEKELEGHLWKISARGKTLAPREKTTPPYYAFGYKQRVYSKNRVRYPLIRVDWEPGGDPAKFHPENRGKSKFRRASWDEVTGIISSEIKRVTEKYGANSIFCIGEDGHKESKDIHSGGGWHCNLMATVNGTFTREVRTPDSVEGWYWGTKHVWGPGLNMGLGMAAPSQNVIKDVSENTDMIVLQSGDWEATQNYASQYWSTIIRFWLDIGIKFVVVDPFCNYTAACHNEMKWIPILPNTDAALDFAIMYVWMQEGTYDKDYVATHVYGFDKLEDYVLGDEDGVPKTPAWAAERCGVPEYTIKALARNWAKQRTCTGHYCGCMVRGPYSHELARTEAYKLGMQGLGAPGIHQLHLQSWTVAWPDKLKAQDPQPLVIGQRAMQFVPQDQEIPRTMVHHAILDGKIEWWGTPSIIYALADEQFERRTYPAEPDDPDHDPEEYAPVHLLWSEKPCNQGCWNGGFLFQDAMRSPEVELYITNHQWIENDSLFADIILPVSTCLEEMDDVGCSQGDAVPIYAISGQAVEPIGESKSDYEIAQQIGKAFDVEDVLTAGMSVEEWIQHAFESSPINAEDETNWEEISDKNYYIFRARDDWETMPSGLREFYEDPEGHPLDTPTGKLEFYSDALAEGFPDDKERPPLAHYITGGPASEGWTHDESLEGERAKKFPFIMNTSPGRWRVHVQNDDNVWCREIETCKVRGKDGYQYEPVWLAPEDAAAKGIEDGDIVKVLNDRGTILGGARVSRRVMPQTVFMNKGSRADPIAPHFDRGGSTNLLSPDGPISKHCWGFVVTNYLVDVEKVTDEEYKEWTEKYPDAFERYHDPDSGQTYESWVIDEEA